MRRDEVKMLKPGTLVVALIGPYVGQVCTVESVEMNSGAYNGWVTCVMANGTKGLYAGEEISLCK